MEVYKVYPRETVVYFIHDRKLSSGKILSSKIDTGTGVITYDVEVIQTRRTTTLNSIYVFESVKDLENEVKNQIKELTKV